jgi:uncharacterized membrane protein (DUF106 family)
MIAAIVGFVLWSIILTLIYFAPGAWGWAVSLCDALLWPLMAACGRWWGVAVLAVLTAVVTLVCQWLCTDVRGLREVRRRLPDHVDALNQSDRDSPEEKAILHTIRVGEWRIGRGAFVPLGLLLGPVILSFLWLPERVDPTHINPAPGAAVNLQAGIDGNFSGRLGIHVDGASLKDSGESLEVVSLRETFESLHRELVLTEQGMPQTVAVKEHLAATGKSPKEAREAIEKFLAGPIPPRVLQWFIATPAEAGAIPVRLEAGQAGAAGNAQATFGTGDRLAPPLKITSENEERHFLVHGQGVVQDLRVAYTDSRPAAERAFWRPYGWAGWGWDAGWLALYLVFYLPTMVLCKKLLRIP